MKGLLACLALVAVLAACSGSGDEPSSAEELARAWSRALNAGDNQAAGALFAVGARIEQPGLTLRVRVPEDAALWTASLPCAGRIVAVELDGDDAVATFRLSDRQTSRCDAPGGRARALFRVRDGKIVLFRQLPVETPPTDAV
jgi:SnoaL-like domain